jgi:hypothetical protein
VISLLAVGPLRDPARRRRAVTWAYRLLWLVAFILILAMPLVIVLRGDVWLGPATLDAANVPDHPLVVIRGNVRVQAATRNPLVVLDGDVTVDAPLGDDLVVVVGDALLGPHAVVDGSVVAIAGQVYRSPEAVVRGVLGARVRDWNGERAQAPPIERVDLARQVRLGLAAGLALLMLSLVVAAILPWSIVQSAATVRRYPIRSALAGVTGAAVVPLVLLPLILSLVGLPLALVLSAGAVVVWFVGLGASGLLLGRWALSDRANGRSFTQELVVGLAAVLLLLAVPVLGPLLVGAVGLLGAGGRIVSFVEKDRVPDALRSIAERE